MKHGYIKLHRQIQDCWVWERKPYSEGQAWIDLLLRASHKDTKIYFDGELVDLKIGSFITSILKLSAAWGWDRKKVTHFLDLLESDRMITRNSTTHGTTITIVKYEDFQVCGTTDSTTEGQPLPQPKDNRSPQSIMLKNDKNDKKNNIGAKSTRFVPPTVEEVRAYCQERKNNVNAQTFVDFYESKGWFVGKNKMKDWKAAVRTWERKDTNPKKENKFESGMKKHNYDFAELEKMI